MRMVMLCLLFVFGAGPISAESPAVALTGGRIVAISPRERVRDERAEIVEVLERNHWNIPRAAGELGMHRTTLWRKVKKLGIEVP